MYENKPLGMFVFSAISLYLTDSIIICDWLSFISIIVISAFPSIILINYHLKQIKNDDDRYLFEPSFIICLFYLVFVGIAYAYWCDGKMEVFQTESFGTTFSMLFIFTTLQINESDKKKKDY